MYILFPFKIFFEITLNSVKQNSYSPMFSFYLNIFRLIYRIKNF